MDPEECIREQRVSVGFQVTGANSWYWGVIYYDATFFRCHI